MSAEASLAMPTGGRGGFAGAAVQTRLVERLAERENEDVSAEASLAMPTGGRGGFAGAAVQTRLVEQLPDLRTTA